jgi:hypothetical protein
LHYVPISRRVDKGEFQMGDLDHRHQWDGCLDNVWS